MDTQTAAPVTGQVKTQIIKDTARYVPSSYLAQALGVINGFILRYFLGPTQMGVWSTIQMIVGYGAYFFLGSTAAGAKEIPFHRAKKDKETARAVQDNIFGLSVTVSLGLVVLLALASWLTQGILKEPVRLGMMGAGVLLIAQRFYTFYIMLLRGHKDFKLLSKVTILTAVLDLGFTLALVPSYGIYGLLGAVVLSMLVSIAYILRASRIPVHFELNRDVILRVSKIGVPMLIYGLLFTLLRSLDKLAILKFMGLRELGIYSVSLMASNYSLGFASMIAIVLLPQFSAKYAKGKDIGAVGNYLTQSLEVIAYVLPSILAVLYFIAPLLVRIFLKQYVAGIPAMQIMIFGSFFLSLVHQPNAFLLAVDKQTLMLPACVIGIIAAGLGLILAGWYFPTLVCITVAICLGYGVYASLLLLICLVKFMPGPRILQFNIRLCLPFVYAVGTAWLLDHVVHWQDPWIDSLAKAFMAMACAALPLWIVDQRTGVMRRTLAIVRERLTRKTIS